MNCHTCHDLLQSRLGGPPAEGPAGLEEHLRQCPDCAGLDRAVGRLAEGLRLLTPPAPPADLAGRITARLCAEARRRRNARLRAAAGLAVAAGLLVALGVRLFRGAPTPPAPVPEVGTHRPDPERPPPLRESVAEAGSALASLTGRTAGETVGETASLLPLVHGPELSAPDAPLPLEPPTRPFREAGAGVSAGLEPVADSARRALGMLLRDMPPMGEDPQADTPP